MPAPSHFSGQQPANRLRSYPVLPCIGSSRYIPTDQSVKMDSFMDSKRQRIIQAAIQVFAKTGLEKGKIADIAEVAGIGKGTVYEYFSSKDELFGAIEEFVISDMLRESEQLLQGKESPRKKLETLIDGTFRYLVTMGDGILIVTELWAQSARGLWHGTSASPLRAMYDQYRHQLTDILREGMAAGEFRDLDPEGVAVMLAAFLDGMLWQYMIINDPDFFRGVWTAAVQSFFRGIEA
ncbi:MAG: TetR/AcrR family transcriptional regulator [Candidatus Neomarinimicrobiota bacterium]|nr:MAG: TetR/AcrR family transcriptional regulator [Candidatus Neomarinimicrobiota bacterium]